jgi:hypothetical protein
MQEYPKAVSLGHYFICCSLQTTNLTRNDISNLCRRHSVIATDNNPAIAASKLQTNLLAIQSWLAKWSMKANGSKSTHITFTTRRGTCPPVHINVQLHLDRRLTWHKHIFTKRKQLGIAITKMYWLLGCKSKLSIDNKLLVYKTILKPIWAYGIQLWGTTSTSNIEILERFQSKSLRMITDAPWYVPNTVIRKDLQIPTVKHEIRRYSYSYSKRISVHPNKLILNLQEPPETRRLRKNLPIDLPTRLNMYLL